MPEGLAERCMDVRLLKSLPLLALCRVVWPGCSILQAAPSWHSHNFNLHALSPAWPPSCKVTKQSNHSRLVTLQRKMACTGPAADLGPFTIV